MPICREWMRMWKRREWLTNDHLPASKMGGDSSTRRHIPNVVLHHGEEIRIEGISDGEERAALDYVEVVPQPR